MMEKLAQAMAPMCVPYTYDSKGRVIGLTEGDSYTCVISYNGESCKTIKTSTENGKPLPKLTPRLY